MTGARSANPFPRPDVNMSPFTGMARAGNFYPRRRRRRRVSLKWDETMLTGSPSPAAGPASGGTRGGGAGAALPAGSHACPQATPSRPRGHRSPLRENVLTSHEHPRGRPKTKQRYKVERLKDNRRGFSVVIYNRDWKMVNQM